VFSVVLLHVRALLYETSCYKLCVYSSSKLYSGFIMRPSLQEAAFRIALVFLPVCLPLLQNEKL